MKDLGLAPMSVALWVVAATAAQAQDGSEVAQRRSAEGAQYFLSQALPAIVDYENVGKEFIQRRVKSISSNGHCSTNVEIIYDNSTSSFVIDWPEVTQIYEAPDGLISITLFGGKKPISDATIWRDGAYQFSFKFEKLGTRPMAALKFLKEECTPLKDSGF